MAYHENLSFCKLLVTVFLVLSANNAGFIKCQEQSTPLVPAMFIFGDSLIDDGNNDNLVSLARANYYPYGIDFPNGVATGRFCNGYTIVDTIANLLGLPLIPPYAAVASGDNIQYGVNYASAAAGILDITGQNFLGRIPFNQQIRNFQNTLAQLIAIAPNAAEDVSKSIFFVAMGSNDYLNNYLMPNYVTRRQYNPQQYAHYLTQQYENQLNSLYNLGARKFVIAGVGLLGCVPNMLAQNGGVCSDDVNNLVQLFNTNTKTMLNNLSGTLQGTKFSYVDISNMLADLLKNAGFYGFSTLDRACCGIGRNRGQITCLPFQMPCTERNQYVFWDAFHPTQAVNILFGRVAFNGSKDFVYPNTIAQLAKL